MSEVERSGKGVPLASLVERINEEHRACEAAVAATLLHAIRCGELLIEAKAGVAQGSWLAWLAANFEASEDTAQVYMRLARHKAELIEEDAERARFSSIRTALVAIAPSQPMPTVPHTAGPLSDGERQRRAAMVAERKGQRLAQRAEYALRTGNHEVPADASPGAWEYALWEAAQLRGRNIPNVIDALGHNLDILLHHAQPDEVGRYLAEPTNDHDEAERREGMIEDLREGVAWLTRVVEEAERARGQEG